MRGIGMGLARHGGVRQAGGEVAPLVYDQFTAANDTSINARVPFPVTQPALTWININGTWQIQSNAALLTAAGPTNYHGRITLNFTHDADFEVDLAIPASGDFLTGIALRISTPYSYLVVADSANGGQISIIDYRQNIDPAGARIVLASAPLPSMLGTTIRLRVVLRNANVYAFVNDVYMCQYNLLALNPISTINGMVAYIGDAYQAVPLDDLKVWSPPSVVPTMDGANTTTNMCVLLPAGFDPAVTHNLVIYYHGLGELAGAILNDALKASLIQDLLTEGYIVADSTAHRNNWGNDTGLQDYIDLYNYLRAEYRIGKVVALSQSMGGVPGLLSVAAGVIPHVGWAGIYPICDLAAQYGLGGSWVTGINTAYGISGDYAEKTAGHDPILLNPALYSLPMRFYASADDTSVSKTNHSDAMATLVDAYADENDVVVCTGNHGDPSHFQSQDLRDFFARCVA